MRHDWRLENGARDILHANYLYMKHLYNEENTDRLLLTEWFEYSAIQQMLDTKTKLPQYLQHKFTAETNYNYELRSKLWHKNVLTKPWPTEHFMSYERTCIKLFLNTQTKVQILANNEI